jgi:hypothetical protein
MRRPKNCVPIVGPPLNNKRIAECWYEECFLYLYIQFEGRNSYIDTPYHSVDLVQCQALALPRVAFEGLKGTQCVPAFEQYSSEAKLSGFVLPVVVKGFCVCQADKSASTS